MEKAAMNKAHVYLAILTIQEEIEKRRLSEEELRKLIEDNELNDASAFELVRETATYRLITTLGEYPWAICVLDRQQVFGYIEHALVVYGPKLLDKLLLTALHLPQSSYIHTPPKVPGENHVYYSTGWLISFFLGTQILRCDEGRELFRVLARSRAIWTAVYGLSILGDELNIAGNLLVQQRAPTHQELLRVIDKFTQDHCEQLAKAKACVGMIGR